MAKKTKVSEATATDMDTSVASSQEDAVSSHTEAASDPSGTNGPDGTDNPESASASEGSGNSAAPATAAAIEGETDTSGESGDAAGEASTDPVKPQDDTGNQPTEAIPAAAKSGTSAPEVEASAPGTNSESSSQEGAAGDAGANAGVSAALTAEQVNALRSQILGVTIRERRRFLVWKPVRHDNVFYGRGGTIILDELAHVELAAKRKVSPSWETGILVEG